MPVTYTFRIPSDLKVGMAATFTHSDGKEYYFIVSQNMKNVGKVNVHVE